MQAFVAPAERQPTEIRDTASGLAREQMRQSYIPKDTPLVGMWEFKKILRTE